jgi:histidine triad (HIT) family protein
LDCAFCAIVRGDDRETPMLATAEHWVAFFPLAPATTGHTLVVPREHVVDLWHASRPLVDALGWAAVELGRAVKAALRPDGMNLITSAGGAAEQTVYHLHLHIVPRWHSDNFGTLWPDKHLSPGIDLSLAGKIRHALQSTRGDATNVVTMDYPDPPREAPRQSQQ